jgi:hypothetical protein
MATVPHNGHPLTPRQRRVGPWESTGRTFRTPLEALDSILVIF